MGRFGSLAQPPQRSQQAPPAGLKIAISTSPNKRGARRDRNLEAWPAVAIAFCLAFLHGAGHPAVFSHRDFKYMQAVEKQQNLVG